MLAGCSFEIVPNLFVGGIKVQQRLSRGSCTVSRWPHQGEVGFRGTQNRTGKLFSRAEAPGNSLGTVRATNDHQCVTQHTRTHQNTP